MSLTKVPAIPAPTDDNLREVARAIKGVIDVREGNLGDPLDANVTFRDLVDGGVATAVSVKRGGGSSSVSLSPSSGVGTTAYDPTTDLTPPPQPAGFSASAGLTTIILQWTAGTYSNHAYTEVWRSATNVIGAAVMIGTSQTQFYSDAVSDPGKTFYYWVRFTSQANIVGPYNATSGTVAVTGQDVTKLVTAMTGPGNPFKVLAEETTLDDGTKVPAGTYTSDAFIHKAQITSAMVGSLTADKITAGYTTSVDLESGTFVGSEFYIGGTTTYEYTNADEPLKKTGIASVANANIALTASGAKFDVGYFKIFNGSTFEVPFEVVGGAVKIKSATVGTIQSGTYTAGLVGWKFTSDGILRAFADSGGRVLDLSATGTSPVLKVGTGLEVLANGTATFGGKLTATAIDAVDTINIKGNAVTFPVMVTNHSSISFAVDDTWQTLLTLGPIERRDATANISASFLVDGSDGNFHYSNKYAVYDVKILKEFTVGDESTGTMKFTVTVTELTSISIFGLETSTFYTAVVDGSWGSVISAKYSLMIKPKSSGTYTVINVSAPSLFLLELRR